MRKNETSFSVGKMQVASNPCAAADAVNRLRFSKPSWPARLIFFRWTSALAWGRVSSSGDYMVIISG